MTEALFGERVEELEAENTRMRETTKRAEQKERKAQHERDEFEVEVTLLRKALEDAIAHWHLGAGEPWEEWFTNKQRARHALRSVVKK